MSVYKISNVDYPDVNACCCAAAAACLEAQLLAEDPDLKLRLGRAVILVSAAHAAGKCECRQHRHEFVDHATAS